MEQKGKKMNESRAQSGFDYESFRQETIAKMLSGDKELTGKDGLLAPLLKDLLDAALSGEMQVHVEQNRPNRRNGGKSKTVKTGHGPVSVEMPRDRDGTFDRAGGPAQADRQAPDDSGRGTGQSHPVAV